LYTGLLSGGVISSTLGSTTFSISSGSAIIVNLNASTGSADPYPTVQYVRWNNLSAPITYSGSAKITYVGIDNTGNIIQQTVPWGTNSVSQWDTSVELGVVLHLSGSVSTGVYNSPQVSYGFSQRADDFLRAFGPLKISGHTLQPSGSTLGLIKTAGTAYNDGANYINNPSHPSTVSDPAITTSKIYRYYVSGSTPVIDTGVANAGYTDIDPTLYNNDGVLTTVPGSGANKKWSIQRVFWIPNSPTNAFLVYYGNATYASSLDAQNAIQTEVFTEAPNTAQNAILIGYIIVRKDSANLSDGTTAYITQGGLFRSINGIGNSNTPSISNTLAGLSDVAISGPTQGDLLVYGGAQWNNLRSLNGGYSITGSLSFLNGGVTASLFGTASYSITSSVAYSGTGSFTGSFIGIITGSLFGTASESVSSSYAYTASSAILAYSSSYAQTSSFANNFTVAGTITAQTLVVSTVSSSVEYSSGSNIFGNSTANTQTMTGSVNITGSIQLTGDITSSGNLQLNGGLINLGSGNGIIRWAGNNWMTTNGTDARFYLQPSGQYFRWLAASGTEITRLYSSGNWIIQNGGTFTDNGYRLQLQGSGSASGSLYSNGFSVFYGAISGSQPSNNPSSSFVLISGSINPTGSAGTGSVVLLNTVISASANNQTLVGLDLNPTFATTGFTGTTSAALRVGGDIIPNANTTYNIGTNSLNFTRIYVQNVNSPGGLNTNSGGSTQITAGATLILKASNNTLSGSTQITGSVGVTGSLAILGSITGSLSGSITGSLFGTASWAQNAVTASYVLGGGSGVGFPFTGSAQITGSLGVTGSVSINGGLTVASNTTTTLNGNLSFDGSSPNILFPLGDSYIVPTAAYGSGNASINIGSAGSGILRLNSNTGGQSNASSTTIIYAGGASPIVTVNAQNLIISSSQIVSGSTQITGSLGVTGSINSTGNITTTGTLTAQTLVVQTITSSITYSSGSNIFGNALTDTQTMTGSVNITGSLTLRGDSILSGSLIVTGSLTGSNARFSGIVTVQSASFDYGQNLSVSAGGYQVIASEATSSFRCAFFDYVMFSGSIVRAGTVTSTWSGSATEYYENYTADLGGSTSGVVLQTAISSSAIQLQASSSTSAWTIRSLIRLL
jgi:hypothetical protein